MTAAPHRRSERMCCSTCWCWGCTYPSARRNWHEGKMHPFDLPGPQFLVFYVVFAAVVIAAFYFGRRRYESGPLPPTNPTDPLLFACLRGGPKEVVRVAMLGLLDRGLLKPQQGGQKDKTDAAPGLVRRRIE